MTHIRRIAAVAALSAVAVAALGTATAAASSATAAASRATEPPISAHHPATRTTTSRPAAAAAGYLARQLTGRHHDHYDGSYLSGKRTIVYVNYGETADAILSMDAAGVAQRAAARATRYLEKHVRAYAGHSAATYAPGPIGKLLLVAEAQHVDVHSFGGLNLVSALDSTEGVRGAAGGEFQQNPKGTPAKYDYFSTVSQALAVLGLADSPHPADRPDAAAVTFLAGQRCAGGGYPTELLSSPAAACAAGKDIDSTGYAIQALLAAGSPATEDLSWLRSVEHPNGGFDHSANANSTALAIQALVAGGKRVGKPEAWLVAHQVGCSAPADRRGAVKFQGTYDASALLATSQAGAALAGKPLAAIDKAGARAAAPVLSCPAVRK